jgi:glycosyltransferase involved in cell wall biosynthesis
MESAEQAPIVSVVIPCYNHGRYLPEAAASVLAQTFQSWELIIVDDGSTDDTALAAERLAAAHPERAIRLISQPNQGLSASRNNGIAAARGRYILTLDADDLIEPEMLAATVAVLDQRPGVGFVYTDVRMFGAETRIWSGGGYQVAKLLLDCPMVPIVLFRRAAWAAVGGFSRNLWPQGYEDWDFWLALAEAGWDGAHIAAPLVRYRRTNGSMLAHARRHDLELRTQLVLNHPRLYDAGMLAWASAASDSKLLQEGVFHSAAAWWQAFIGYLAQVARLSPRHIPKTLVRPIFCRLSARQQGYVRSFARLLHMRQAD